VVRLDSLAAEERGRELSPLGIPLGAPLPLHPPTPGLCRRRRGGKRDRRRLGYVARVHLVSVLMASADSESNEADAAGRRRTPKRPEGRSRRDALEAEMQREPSGRSGQLA
jgi:hypothetical protein